jgi:hypothetical protein
MQLKSYTSADLNTPHSLYIELFDGMPFRNSRWDKESAKCISLFEVNLQMLKTLHQN